MNLLDIAALLMTVAALFAYFNHRYLHLPRVIGLMVISLGMSLAIIVVGKLGLGGVENHAKTVVGSIDFDKTLMHGMLSFLLFAGALHVDLSDLLRQKWVILILASVGVVVSTLLIGVAALAVFGWLGIDMPLIYCLLLGAIISPTDPIAVLGILKTAGAPKSQEIKITGESLFNDGFAVVVFVVLASLTAGEAEPGVGQIALLFAEEALGGALFGLALGGVAYYLLKQSNDYQLEVLITLATVMGGYSLATAIHVSGPIAVVIAGLLIGNHGRLYAMSSKSRANLDTFWELLDETLNAILFVLMGLELLVLSYDGRYLLAALLIIPVSLLARFITVGTLVGLFRFGRSFAAGVVKILTWGGLRGGVSVALALSLSPGPERGVIVAVTYAVVVFSVIVQGLSLGRLIRWIHPPHKPVEAER
ncbi:MAG: sodium:proton antiporter [Gammaproteobacteria bacterium]|jgi:CPA1 family monovalent cation:H+ antiporter|nr:sodium:proton antiporter [Gammaproteobacteria bacterium]